MTAATNSSQLRRVAFALLCVVTLANAIAVAFALPRSAALVTTYAGSSGLANLLDLAAGLSLLAAGLVAWHERSGGSLGPLSALTSIVWFAPAWVGWEEGPPLARSVAMLVAPFGVALVLHVALAAPRGRLPRGPAGGFVVAGYVVTAVVSTATALLRDPFEDPGCWSNCADNVFFVAADRGIAAVLAVLWPIAALAGGALITGAAAWRVMGATRPARQTLGPVLVPAAVVGASEFAYATAVLGPGTEHPERIGFALIFDIRAIAFLALAAGIAWTAVRARRTRAAVAQLHVDRDAAPLRDVLARALGDSGLLVAYPLPGSDRAVDASGDSVDLPAPEGGRTVTRILRDGEPVALIAHDASLLDGQALAREIGAAARLVVDNERLQASLLAQLEDLRMSRIRTVETGDATRRKLERDLHDGAQQRLLALSYELRLALADASSANDDRLVTLLARANEEARTAMAELRELAHGIHPAILADAGLEAALAGAADTAPIPVQLRDVTLARHPASVETAAFVVVTAAIADAARRHATHVIVGAVQRGDCLSVRVQDDGSGAQTAAQHLVDRVGALGGRIESHVGRLEADIPCA